MVFEDFNSLKIPEKSIEIVTVVMLEEDRKVYDILFNSSRLEFLFLNQSRATRKRRHENRQLYAYFRENNENETSLGSFVHLQQGETERDWKTQEKQFRNSSKKGILI